MRLERRTKSTIPKTNPCRTPREALQLLPHCSISWDYRRAMKAGVEPGLQHTLDTNGRASCLMIEDELVCLCTAIVEEH